MKKILFATLLSVSTSVFALEGQLIHFINKSSETIKLSGYNISSDIPILSQSVTFLQTKNNVLPIAYKFANDKEESEMLEIGKEYEVKGCKYLTMEVQFYGVGKEVPVLVTRRECREYYDGGILLKK